MRKLALKLSLVLMQVAVSGAALAADAPREPMAVLSALADRIYSLGETTGKVEDMVAAEAKAGEAVRQYVASGATEGLLAAERGGQSPLAAAAYMGYPNVVAALLTSKLVRAHIDDVDGMGLTPWMAANLAMKQSLWTCNPAVFDDPFRFVPTFVTQPYYIANPVPPYKKTRQLLEEAGAARDMAKAKEFWLANCKTRSAPTRAKVKDSGDLQETLQTLGFADLTAQLAKLEQREAQTRRK